MDITYTSEFDAKRYERLIARALGLGPLRVSFFCWCMAIFGGLWILDDLLRHYDFDWLDWTLLVVLALPFAIHLIRRLQARQVVKILQRMLGDEKTTCARLTDDGYEVSCGAMNQKMPWSSLGSFFHFLDDDTVALLHIRSIPSLVLYDLSRHGIARGDLEEVLTRAGLRKHKASWLRRVWSGVAGIIGSLLVLIAAVASLPALLVPCSSGQLVFSNECAVSVEKAVVSFGRNVVEFGEIYSQEEKVRDFFVGGDCTCRVVATLADGMVVSNSHGYFCYGMGCGRVDVVVTKDRRIEIVDRLNRETVETERWLRATRLPAVHLNAPATMEDFAKYMNEASRDYDDPRRQPDERDMEFTCSDLVKKRAFPVQTDPRGTPIPCIQASDVSFWEVLEQACRLTDCHINVFGRTIFIWPNAEKGVSVNDIPN